MDVAGGTEYRFLAAWFAHHTWYPSPDVNVEAPTLAASALRLVDMPFIVACAKGGVVAIPKPVVAQALQELPTCHVADFAMV